MFQCFKVLERDYEYPILNNLKNKHTYWKCQSKCGQIKTYSNNEIRRKQKLLQEYNCEKCFIFWPKDLVGMTFGRLTVIEKDNSYAKEHNIKQTYHRFWKCQCSCGQEIIVDEHNLKYRRVLSCGCCTKEKTIKTHLKDLTGQVFGYLTVKGISNEKRSGATVWHCQCKCGNETDVIGSHLVSGDTKSCGCYRKEYISNKNQIDITNQRFGKLIALYRNGKNKDGILWHCKCDCGNECDVLTSLLTSGKTSSCGCIISIGEMNIQRALQENNIKFEKQKTFENLKSAKNYPYRYDFYLPEYNRLIEFDGEQHYSFHNTGWATKEKFIQVQRSDQIKNEYAKNQGIDLVRIPYFEKNKITIDMILGNQYLLNFTSSKDTFNIEQKQFEKIKNF